MASEPKQPSGGAEQGPLLDPRIPFEKETPAEFAVGTLKTIALVLAVGITLVFSLIYGWTIYESYFKLPEEVEVPVITGKTVEEANEMLAKLGLRLQVHESRYTGKPEKEIISQNPAPKRKVREGNEILVVVSLGPELMEVPDLMGKSLREVEIELANNALKLGKVTWSKPDPEKPEEVLKQEPAPGKKVKKGTSVDVKMQKGGGPEAMTPVPNLKGKPIYTVTEALARADLQMGGITWKFHQVAARGEVIEQGPPAGSKVSARTLVEFEVSAGPPEGRAYRSRQLAIDVPTGADAQRVSVLLNNGVGTDTVFDGRQASGDTMKLLVSGLPGSEVEVYINDKLTKREKL